MKNSKNFFRLGVLLFFITVFLFLPCKNVFADVIAKQDQHNGQISGLLGSGSYNIQTLGSGLSGLLDNVQLWTVRYGNPSTVSVQILCYNESSYSTTCANSSTSTAASVSTTPSQITLTGLNYQLDPTKYYMIKANVSDGTNQTIIYGVGSGNLWPNGNCWYPQACQTNTGVDYYFILNTGSGASLTPTATPTPTPSPLTVLYSQTDGSSLSNITIGNTGPYYSATMQQLGSGLTGKLSAVTFKFYNTQTDLIFVFLECFNDSNYVQPCGGSTSRNSLFKDVQVDGEYTFTWDGGSNHDPLELDPTKFYRISVGSLNGYKTKIYGSTSNTWANGDCTYRDTNTCAPNNDLYFKLLGTSATPTPTPSPKLPVILIPGGMGSEFEVKETNFNPKINNCLNFPYLYAQNETVWLNQNPGNLLDNASCGKYLDVLKLDQNGNEIYPQVGLKGVISANILGKHLGYYDLIPFFEQKGYILNKDFFIFPYDWRKDIKENITELNNKIDIATNSAGTNKAQIIAHSMGGLIARDYIRDSERAKKVHTLVELGVPHAGIPTYLAHLLYSKCFNAFTLVCVVNGDEINKLAQNFPGIFELLPNKLYYQLYTDSKDYPFKKNDDALNYDQTRSHLSELGKNMKFFDNAESYHTALAASYSTGDAFNTDTNGVKTYLIAGSGKPTIGQIHDYVGLNLLDSGPIIAPKLDMSEINGDETVPLLSATLGKLSQVYYVNQTHGDLASGTALQMTYNLLNGQTADISGVQSIPFTLDGEIISVHSPVVLHAYDNLGNHTGPKDDGTIELGIPGSSYDELGESKFIYLQSGGNYNIKTKATGEGSFDLKIKKYTQSELTQEQLYLSIPQTASSTASMTLDVANPTLQVDTDNNGTIDKNITPSSTLSGEALNDTQAPTTTVQESGTQGTNDWYTSGVTLSFTSQDEGGAGVLNTYYYKDGEETLHEAGNSVAIDTEGATKIWYLSVDKAGNTEQPKNITVHIDKTAPAITYTGRTDANSKGWNNNDVTVNWTCADETSGVVNTSISETVKPEGKDQSVTGTCTDKTGNAATDTQKGINIDKTNPTITITSPQNDATYILNSIVNADWNTNDDLSGIAIENGTVPSGSPIDTSKVGPHEFSVTATDNAGNTISATVNYKVIYRFDGFLQPINDTAHEQTCGTPCTVSTFKGGSTVPVKFQLKDVNGIIVQSTNLPQWITPQQGTAITESIDETVFTDPATSGTTYTWDIKQYHYNWGTKGFATGYYWLIGVTLDDGQTYAVNIGLR